MRHLEVANVRRRTVEERDLARLLVRHREHVLEAAVSVTELVTTTLLGLDTLTADLLATVDGTTRTKKGKLQLASISTTVLIELCLRTDARLGNCRSVVVIVIREVVRRLGLAAADGGARRRCHRVEPVRCARNHRRRRVRA